MAIINGTNGNDVLDGTSGDDTISGFDGNDILNGGHGSDTDLAYDADGMIDVWAMDFPSDKLFDGQPFRILTIVDCHTREPLETIGRTNFRAYQVVEELDCMARNWESRGAPGSTKGPSLQSGRLTSGLIWTRSS